MRSVNGNTQWSQRFRTKKRLAPDRNWAFPWHSWAVASAVRAWLDMEKLDGKKNQGHSGMPQSLSRIGLTERLRIEILTNQASDCTNLTLHLLSNYWLKLKKTLMVLLSKNLWASHWWVPLTARTWKSRNPHDASRDRWFTPNLWPASSPSLSTCCGSQQTDCCWSK